MSKSLVDKVAEAVLYEGYVLYPYRPSSVKNRHRWTFGGLYPRAYAEGRKGSGDAWMAEAQCLVVGDNATSLRVAVRFLHLMNRTSVPDTDTWQEATERSVELEPFTIAQLVAAPRHHEFTAAADATPGQESIAGAVDVAAERVGADVFRITARISNRTEMNDGLPPPTRDAALMRSLVSCHAVLYVAGGRFVSLTDPPDELRGAAAACRNVGVWPVLVGEAGQADTMLASPIILPDYPEIAPESPGDLFDGTEIDEILTLRILTLTDEEKRQAAAADPRVEAMLARTESLAREQLMNLHGTTRGGLRRPICTTEDRHMADWDPLEARKTLESYLSAGVELKPGDRVRLRPAGGADIFDLALAGRVATIAAIEQDYENRIHLAVTVDDDPGRDLGIDGKPGHRFFFSPEEVEVLGPSDGGAP